MLTSFAGSQFFGESYGAGTPRVLALHGWGRDHRDFNATLANPEPAVDAIAVDLPGFGGTPPPVDAWGSTQYAEALVPVLDEMGDKVVVVGHSFGGRVAVHLASLAGERVAGLVLTGAPLFRLSAPPKPPLQLRVVRRLSRSGLVSGELLERYRQRYGSADYRAASGVVREILVRALAEDYSEAISEVGCRVELVWGDDDIVVPLPVAQRIRDTLPNGAHLVVCPGAGHLTPASVPGELRAAIERLYS